MRIRKLTRQLVDLIIKKLEEDYFKINDGFTSSLNTIEIYVKPRRLHIFDGIELLYRGDCVWLPLLQRLRLRRHFRKYLIYKMLDQLQ